MTEEERKNEDQGDDEPDPDRHTEDKQASLWLLFDRSRQDCLTAPAEILIVRVPSTAVGAVGHTAFPLSELLILAKFMLTQKQGLDKRRAPNRGNCCQQCACRRESEVKRKSRCDQRDFRFQYPVGESNPCLHLERVVSWATRRTGRCLNFRTATDSIRKERRKVKTATRADLIVSPAASIMMSSPAVRTDGPGDFSPEGRVAPYRRFLADSGFEPRPTATVIDFRIVTAGRQKRREGTSE